MDIYDFDGTLYKGDSTANFLRFCLRRHPRITKTLPRSGVAAFACLGLHKIDKTKYKESLYRFLPLLPDVERDLYLFWSIHERNIDGPCNPQPGDLVISASPEFLLRGVCERRGLMLIASQVDPHTGNVLGPNCSGEEKAVRLRERFPHDEIENFYSDSHNDDPLAHLAKHAFMVNARRGTVVPWPKRG